MVSKIKQTPVKYVVNIAVIVALLLAAVIPAILAQRAQALFNFPGYNGKIVYVSNESGNDEIYIINADGTGKTNITNDPEGDTLPRWSPDGTRLIFVSARDGGTDLFSMKPDGSDVQQLTTGGSVASPNYSYDGSKILYVDNGDIYTINPDGTGKQQLTNDTLAAVAIWSPDNSKVAYSHEDPDDDSVDLYMMNADGSGKHVILETNDFAFYQSWSPDGTKIAYANYPADTFEGEIYTINPDGSQNTQLSNTGGQVNIYAGQSSWSQDSTRLIFTQANVNDGVFDLMMINRDGTDQHIVKTDSTVGSWSPDNTQILANNYGGDFDLGLFVVSTDGSEQNRVATGQIFDFSWQPLTIPPVSDPQDPSIPYNGSPVTYNVVDHTTDAYGGVDPTTVTITEQPTQGTVSVDPATGVITYTPNPNATSHTDHFTYRVCSLASGQLCTTNTITITGIPVGGQLAPTGMNTLVLYGAAVTVAGGAVVSSLIARRKYQAVNLRRYL